MSEPLALRRRLLEYAQQRLDAPPEPDWRFEDADLVLRIRVVLEGERRFGNAALELTHEKDSEFDLPSALSLSIAAALTRLLERENDDAFVILTDPNTERFVQFAHVASAPLLIDLPATHLTPTQAQRARQLFGAMGAEPEEHRTIDQSGRPSRTVWSSCQFLVTDDVELRLELELAAEAEELQARGSGAAELELVPLEVRADPDRDA